MKPLIFLTPFYYYQNLIRGDFELTFFIINFILIEKILSNYVVHLRKKKKKIKIITLYLNFVLEVKNCI